MAAERRPGIASFRAVAIGDIARLYARGQELSVSAHFCEVYGDGDRAGLGRKLWERRLKPG